MAAKNRTDLTTYLEEELVRLGDMQARVVCHLAARAGHLHDDLSTRRCADSLRGDVELVMAVAKGLSEVRNRLTELYVIAQIRRARYDDDDDSD